ncbi:MAG: hypothetical protein ACI93T_001447 [Porticoccaceae bacterium]|jgi:hypothetical protein
MYSVGRDSSADRIWNTLMFRKHTLCLVAILAAICTQSVSAAPPPTGDKRFDAALVKAISFLKQKMLDPKLRLHGGYHSLPAYALSSAGEPKTLPQISQAVDEVKTRIKDGVYKPSNGEHHIYEAGVDAMLMESTGGDAHYNELKAISDYIISKQGADGSWDYPARTVGDTSMAQYGVLGLWAASRVSVDIPKEVWDKAAMWHIRTQRSDGGFQYHPGMNMGGATGGNASSINMTAGATGSLGIIQIQLYPDSMKPESEREGPKKKAFGILEAKEPDPAEGESGPYKVQTTLTQFENARSRGLGWATSKYLPISPLPHKIYYNYALERAAALNGAKLLGGKIDWFKTSGEALVKLQEPEGSWQTFSGTHVGTSFAILFFIRPTKKAVSAQYGGGLLTGGRGLPTDLANADVSGGAVKQKRKIEGPLDELLTELSALNPDSIADAQAAIVEKVQVGNREDLLGEMDRIRDLIAHPNPELRRTAVWALGRSGDLKDANLLISSLNDNNVDVLTEAYNSLSYLSRKIDGVDMDPSPFAGLSEFPTQPEKDAAMVAWRKQALKNWGAWYLRVRPYSERNDIFELGLKTKRK